MTANWPLFSVIGVVERFDESLVLMKRRLGWEFIPYYTRMQTSEGYDPSPSPELRELATLHLGLDDKFYHQAVVQFNAAIEAEGPSFGEELRSYRQGLAEAQSMARIQEYEAKAKASSSNLA